MTARPAAHVIRKYFIDPPDAARLEDAEDRLRDAEDRLESAIRRRDAFEPKPPPAPVPLPQAESHPGYTVAAVVVLAFGAALVVINPWFAVIAFVCLVASIALVNAGIAARAADRSARADAVAAAKKKKAARQQENEQRERDLHDDVDRAYDRLDHAREVYDDEADAYEEAYRRSEPKPSDALMDRTLLDDIATIKEHALVRLRLHRSELVRPAYMREMTQAELENAPANTPDVHDPFVVYGPAYGADYPVWCALGQGRHAKRRYSRYKVMVICTTRYHIALYWCVLDFFTGELDEETTAEYHYADVVAVHSETDSNSATKINIHAPRESQRHLRDAPQAERYFELVVSSGDRARIVTGLTRRRTADRSGAENPEHFHVLGNDPNFDAVADSIRMMLREKKSGTNPR